MNVIDISIPTLLRHLFVSVARDLWLLIAHRRDLAALRWAEREEQDARVSMDWDRAAQWRRRIEATRARLGLWHV